jgi:cellulose biosynthesis protein BcsQ
MLTADSKKEAVQHIQDAYMKRVVILDCPSRASDATAAIAAMSTLTVFPLVPGKKDSYLTLATMHKVIAEGVAPEQLAIVLTRCQTAAEIRDLAEWIKDNSPYSSRFGLITPALLEKPVYRNAIAKGLSITEVAPIQLRHNARAVVHAIIGRFSMLEDAANTQENAA